MRNCLTTTAMLLPACLKTNLVDYPPLLRYAGLYALRPIPSGTHLHTAPCLIFSLSSYTSHASKTVLEHYLFNLPDGRRLLALGYGSIFNHRDTPNVDYRASGEGGGTVTYTTCRDVEEGEEVRVGRQFGGSHALLIRARHVTRPITRAAVYILRRKALVQRRHRGQGRRGGQ